MEKFPEKLSGKVVRCRKKLPDPEKIARFQKISVRTEKFDIPGKSCQIPGKVEISGKSGKVALLAKFSV